MNIAPRPVAVRFLSTVALPYDATAADRLKDATGRAWAEMVELFPGVGFGPYFDDFDLPTLQRFSDVQPVLGNGPFAFTSWYRIECPEGIDPYEVAEVMRGWPGVHSAYVEGIPTPAGITGDPDSYMQGYLDPAPDGIDARHAWSASASGKDVGLVDLEPDWNPGHVEMPAGLLPLIWGDRSGVTEDIEHGTNALGVVVAKADGAGIAGIAAESTARLVSHVRSGDPFRVPAAILKAADAMRAGDVLLVEVQTESEVFPRDLTFGVTTVFPVEVEQLAYDAIVYAVSRGIVVVEVAGNGSYDLDKQNDPSAGFLFKKSVRDSGAIVVAAATASAPHDPHGFSNVGSRVDCYAWGDSVYTASNTGPSNYKSGFGGTSGAAAIVAGAALLVQSDRLRRLGATLPPLELRALLADRTAAVNTPSRNGVGTDKIGVMPNLASLIPSTVIARVEWHWNAIVRILYGVANDGGGVVWVPGRGPSPVDPWGPHFADLDPARRDPLIGLALAAFAQHATGKANKKKLRKLARRLLNDAAKNPNRDS